MNRGINLNPPTGLQHQDAVVGTGANYGNLHKPSIYYYADVDGLSGISRNIRRNRKAVWQKLGWVTSQGYQERQNPVLFSAAFNPDLNEYSWASIEYFLNLLYNPLTYIKKIEIYVMNKDLTEAFFMGGDYGNYIHCGTFTLIGDLCKSLSWIQRNVRADMIHFPGDLTHVETSYMHHSECTDVYKEACIFLLDTPWMSSNQTRTLKIRLERLRYWTWFIKSLIKKFRTLATFEHNIPSIEFYFRKSVDTVFNLSYLAWEPDVVKLNPEDSQGAEAAYLVSHGRNRMEVGIFKRYGVESDTTPNLNDFSCLRRFNREREATYDVYVKMYTIDSAAQPRENIYVHILSDTWLEALKFLSFPAWSKALFVCRQLAGVAQGNISRLPCCVIENATMSEMRSSNDHMLLAFDDKIPSSEEKQFFTDRGIYLNAPASVQQENVAVGLSSKNVDFKFQMCLRGTAQDMQQVRKPIIFSAQFSKQKEYSWAALKYFLEFIYYTAVYTKEVEMFVLNQELIDELYDGEERFIRCGAFTWKGKTEPLTMVEMHKSLSWIERNVRANLIYFPEHIDYEKEKIYESLAIFLMNASWKCTRQEVNFKCLCNMDSFVKALIEKFRSVSFVRNNIPMLTATTYGYDETLSFLLMDPSVLKLKSWDSEGGAEVYLISQEDNRMQIEIFKESLFFHHGFYGNYSHHEYHDIQRNRALHKLEIYIKVNTI